MLKKKVIESFEMKSGARCVDIMHFPDGSFSFQEFRKDAEDTSGWFPIGQPSTERFDTRELAISAAVKKITWLAEEFF